VAKAPHAFFQQPRPLFELVLRTAGLPERFARQFPRQFALFPALHQFRKFYLNSSNLENTGITGVGQDIQ
jgi:hypothetical protein